MTRKHFVALAGVLNTTGDKTMVEFPKVPEAVTAIAADWHSGQRSQLYAVSSTGGLTFTERFTRYSDAYDIAERLADRWSLLATELEAPLLAGDIDQATADEVDAIASRLADQAEALERG